VFGFDGRVLGFDGRVLGFDGRVLGFDGRVLGFDGIFLLLPLHFFSSSWVLTAMDREAKFARNPPSPLFLLLFLLCLIYKCLIYRGY